MNIALDIDGTISDHPAFFAAMASGLRAAGHRVYVLTYRDPSRTEATRAQLGAWGVEFDELVIAASLNEKGSLCDKHAIDVFFDDQDECLVGVPERVFVCKVRNGGNFNFDRKRWLSTSQLTENLR